VIALKKSKYFNLYFNEEGEEMAEGDPNAEGAAPPPPPAMLDIEDTDSDTDKKFPEEKDGTTPEQDLLNFTNYQKLQYFKKFNNLLELLEKTKITFNNSKHYITFDEINDENQHKIINLLISSLEETTEQINFFLEKGISSVNIDKTRAIFNAIVKKINIIIDSFENVMRNVKQENDENKNK
jgi:hypothetical protein